MSDLIWIILDVACLIAFVYFIHCEKQNTKARKEQTIELKKQNKILDEAMRRTQDEQKN